jgi:hypothetical protein
MPPIGGQSQCQRGAGVIGPDLYGIGHAVPARLLAGAQQIINGSGVAAAAAGRRVTVGLDEMAALGMGLQPEPRDDGGRVVAHTMSLGVVAAIDGRLL